MAIVLDAYGSADVLQLRDAEIPAAGAGRQACAGFQECRVLR